MVKKYNLEYLLKCIKINYKVENVYIISQIKISNKGVSYKIEVNNKLYYAKVLFDCFKSIFYQNDEIYKRISGILNIAKIIRNTKGELCTYISKTDALIICDWINISNQKIDNMNKYIEIIYLTIDKLFNINVSNIFDAKLLNLYRKKTAAIYLYPRFDCSDKEYFIPLVYIEKLKIINKFYEKHINIMKNRVSKCGEVNIIHGDLNTSNIVQVDGIVYIVDLESMRLGFWFEDIDVVGLDLCVNPPIHKKFLQIGERLYGESPIEIICGEIIALNNIFRYISNNRFPAQTLNTKYYVKRIDSIYEILKLI